MNRLYTNFRYYTDKVIMSGLHAINKVTHGKKGGMMFIDNIDIKPIDTTVKVIARNEDTIDIAKVDKNGKIINDDFRILSTTDFHFEDNIQLRNKCLSMFYKQIKATKPDLIILTGDVIQSKYQHFDAIQFAEFMEKIGIYWCYCYGNHEAREFDSTFKRLILDMMMRYEHCLCRFGSEDVPGCSNYCINILKNSYEIKKSLFIFDSGRDITDESRKKYLCDERTMKKYGLTNESNQNSSDVHGYDFIKPEQTQWYLDKLNTFARLYRFPGDKKKFPKSFIYMHIPICEYKNIIEEVEPNKFKFRDDANVLYGGVYESVGCSPINSGLFKKAKDIGSVEAFFSGHDHVNDFDAIYDGVHLVYNQYNGYESYTPKTPEKEWMHGATITDIDENGNFRISQRKNSIYL